LQNSRFVKVTPTAIYDSPELGGIFGFWPGMHLMRTEDLTFFHGTGRAAANSILEFGARNLLFEEIGARRLGREIRQALLKNAELSPSEDYKLHFAFKDAPRREYSSLWVPAFLQLEDNNEGSHHQYGHFFVTLDLVPAYRYAMTPFRSEFILALAESLKMLTYLGDPLPQTVATCFPEVARLIETPSPPMVLELKGISEERILNEKGSRDCDPVESFNEMQADPEISFNHAFQILDVTFADIVAVHDLSDWSAEEHRDSSWRPDRSRVAASRHSVQKWLANEKLAARR
jgi:hypothetical protein